MLKLKERSKWVSSSDNLPLFPIPPSFDVPTYSIHVDNGVHFRFPDSHHEVFSHQSDDESLFGSVQDDNSINSLPSSTAV